MSDFIYKHKVISTLLVLWTIVLVSLVTYQVFIDITKITASVAGAFATVFGLPAVAAGVYKWRNDK